MPVNLEGRFHAFLSSLPGSEDIDQLQLPLLVSRGRRADFLLANREVIVEIKTLSVDTSTKIEPAVEKHRQRDEFPVFYGEGDLRKVLAHLPDGEAAFRRIYLAITRSVEDAVRSAEEQIADTRHALGLPNAVGLLVILNESIKVLNPNVVGYRVSNLMRRTRTGRSASETIDFTWLLFESHIVRGPKDRPTFASMLLEGRQSERHPWFQAFALDVLQRWASFNGAPFVDDLNPDPNAHVFRPTDEVHDSGSQGIPRHEFWRRQYRTLPYLRELSDTEVLECGRLILDQVTPYLVQGGLGYVPDVVTPLMERFTHFLEEANFRALDLRDIRKP